MILLSREPPKGNSSDGIGKELEEKKWGLGLIKAHYMCV